MHSISEKIRLMRLQRGYSQENMADMLSLSVTAYGDIERGKTEVTVARLLSIAQILETTAESLLSGNEATVTPTPDVVRLEMEKLQIENEKLKLENQYLREKLAGRLILEAVREQITASERPRIGF
jgi:XRE family transcriptional regulator, regulator of sulfur utilization